MSNEPNEYTVAFAIDVTADSPQQACALAWDLLSQSERYQPIGEVTCPNGAKLQIELTVPTPSIVQAGCARCGHLWIPRQPNRAIKICPKCKSPYWNTPRKQAVDGAKA